MKISQNSFLTLGHICAKHKDRIAEVQRKDDIYSIPCNDCNREYIGQTKRQRLFFPPRRKTLGKSSRVWATCGFIHTILEEYLQWIYNNNVYIYIYIVTIELEFYLK